MSVVLRPYQNDCVEAITDAHKRIDSALVAMPTGVGKTVVFARYASKQEYGRALVVCPQIELVDQAAQKLFKETGIMPAIEQGANYSNEADWGRCDFIVASKQTLCRRRLNGPPRYKRFEGIGLVVVDEAHTAVTREYSEMLGYFRTSGAKILGVTATPKRHDKRAMGQVFDACVYQYGIREAIDDGWLVEPKVRIKQLQHLDLSKVETSTTWHGKDFNTKQLNEQLENPEVIWEICEAVNEETRGKKTAIYCSSVNEAQAVSELLCDQYGIRAAWVCSDKKRCTDDHRQEVLASFANDPNGISHLANVGILTTGWDCPHLEAIVMARPTKSKVLHTQILGRGTRPLPGVVDFDGSTPGLRRQSIAGSAKPHFLFIDMVDATLKHKIVTATDVLEGSWTTGQPVTCLVCQTATATQSYNGWPTCTMCRDKVEQRLKEMLLNKGDAITIDDAVEKAREEQRDEEDELRRKRRAEIAARATFTTIEGDAFGGSKKEVDTRGGSGKVLCTEKQAKCLWAMGLKDVGDYQLTKAQAGRMIGQLKSGMPVATVRQVNRLGRVKQGAK